jgi:hypothetical protein
MVIRTFILTTSYVNTRNLVTNFGLFYVALTFNADVFLAKLRL